MHSRPNILFVIPSIDSGGIQNYLLRFLKMKKSEMDVSILVRCNHHGDLYEEFRMLSIPIIFMPLGYISPAKWFKFLIFINKHKFQTICDFNANFGGITIWLANIAGVKNRIAFYRQGKDHFDKSTLRTSYNFLMNRLVYKYSTKILANSKAGLDFFFPYRIPEDRRFRIIYNGINVKQYKTKVDRFKMLGEISIPEDAFVIGHIGRLDKSKNHSTILSVASQLIGFNHRVYLILCGSGTEALEEKVAELGISENVRLLGYRSDTHKLLKIFSLFYFPSLTEGQPNALIEAMASGVPIIASNIEPIKEIMPENARLYDPFEVQQVVNFIKEALNNSQTLDRLTYVDYAESKFNAEERFMDFLCELA